ncbi:MAG: YjdF family protein [Luoshenia tenuis]
MEQVKATLTVLFEDPFWVGVYERECDGRYGACKLTFGAEPRDYEVYAALLQNWARLEPGREMAGQAAAQRRINPKRMQRAVRRQTQDTGMGTRAQQALKLQQAAGKLARRKRTREEREREAQRQFALRQQRKKDKHKGH